MLRQLDTLIGFVVVMSVVSLLITIITQMISSLLGLRGKNLADALHVMILKLHPEAGSDAARQLAEAVLTQPVVSDSVLSMHRSLLDRVPLLARLRRRWRTATAIRPDELLDIIREMAAESGGMSTTASGLLARLQVADPATKTAIDAVQGKVNELAAKSLSEAETLIHQFASATDVAFVNLEKWFGSAQDRAKQWFAMHARWITIIASVLAAFVLQLDAIALLKRISADPDLRAKLVATADALQKEGQSYVTGSKEVPVTSAAHKQALTELRKTFPELPLALDTHADFASVASAQAWLASELQGNPQRERIVSAYEEAIVRGRLGDSADALKKVVADYEKTGLQLLPDPYPYPFKGAWSWPFHRLLGILMSAALLSLGAPFWFNLLKSLTNLRPKLAEQISRDPRQASAKSTR